MTTDFVTALLIMNGLILGLCGLLLGSRRWLASYGKCKLQINGERTIEINGGGPLLGELVANKIFIPSACGGRGTCGYCRVEVPAGGGAVLPTEQLVLSPADVARGLRLACQVRVRGDLAVRIPDEYLAIREFRCELAKIEVMTDLIKKLTFRLLEPTTITFKAGQYVQVAAEIDGATVYRGYSLANSPLANDHLELNVRRVEGGAVSPWLHRLELGAQLVVSGPYGEFFLQERTGRAVVCVAGGVGLAPMKSIIRYLTERRIDRPLYLFYGARNRALLYDHELFVGLAKENPKFHYVPALSEVAATEEWTGHRGLITAVFAEVFPAGEPAEAYLCGPPVMIEAVLPLLQAKGIAASDIYYDKF